ncbi:MAG: hypothetical protein A2W35_17655 [Chloroflexi bacterium RBG_16_57_11]|nr:MAG: hypothetical protein A2W35_17655 [Chloroflexi bacterium RBG_16_57_11]
MKRACWITGVIFLASGMAAFLAGCLPAATPLPPLPTETPGPPTATPTATIVWFPPTATFTPLPPITPGITPTLDLSPAYGSLIFSDDFLKPELWTLGRSGPGSAALGVSELSLVVSQPRGYLLSLRQETALSDFYLEITASPSICRGADEYGLLVRLASLQDFLRFGLNCRGEVRLDRLNGGEASSPFPPEISGAVPPGAPSTSRLGVWALGKELRFYANGQYLFTVSDPVLQVGGLGVYARASGDDTMTVNFSDLDVYEATR